MAKKVMFLLHFVPDVKVPSDVSLCKYVRHHCEHEYMSLYRFDIETVCMLPGNPGDTPPCHAIALHYKLLHNKPKLIYFCNTIQTWCLARHQVSQYKCFIFLDKS